MALLKPANTYHRGKDHYTACLQFNKIGFDQKETMWLLVGSDAVESKLVQLETSRTVMFPPIVSVL